MLQDVKRSIASFVIKAILYALAAIAAVTGALALSIGTRLVPAAGAVTASLDNEFRFFSVFWVVYGMDCFNTARHLNLREGHVPRLSIVILIAGIARTLSIVFAGMPAAQYFYGAMVEYLFAALLFISHRTLKH